MKRLLPFIGLVVIAFGLPQVPRFLESVKTAADYDRGWTPRTAQMHNLCDRGNLIEPGNNNFWAGDSTNLEPGQFVDVSVNVAVVAGERGPVVVTRNGARSEVTNDGVNLVRDVNGDYLKVEGIRDGSTIRTSLDLFCGREYLPTISLFAKRDLSRSRR